MIDAQAVQSPPRKSASDAELRIARGALAMGSSGLREIMELASRPGVLSFAVGLPATELFPREDLADAASRVLAEPAALQYALPLRRLKEEVVGIMALRGVRCRPEQVFLTSGAQQAMDLLAHLLLDRGGQVALEETTYDGIRIAVRRFEPQILSVPAGGATGLDVDAFEALLDRGARPAFLYLMPESHNPLGVSLSLEARRRLAQLARSYRVPLLEDDTYGLLGDGPTAPALASLDAEWIFYIGSFSKILAPALRVGWTVVPEALIPRLSMLKHAADVDTASVGHRTVEAFLAAGKLPAHLERLRREYRLRREAMLSSLDAAMPPGVRWSHPAGGLYVWVELPRPFDTTALLRAAVETEQVAFSPGVAFAATEASDVRHCLRLSFGNCSPERIEEGIRRLGRVVARFVPAV